MIDPPDNPEVDRSLREANPRLQELHAELLDAYPALRETLAISGMFVGHGLGAFVANGMTDDQIVAQVLAIVAHIRQMFAKIQAPETPEDDEDDGPIPSSSEL